MRSENLRAFSISLAGIITGWCRYLAILTTRFIVPCLFYTVFKHRTLSLSLTLYSSAVKILMPSKANYARFLVQLAFFKFLITIICSLLENWIWRLPVTLWFIRLKTRRADVAFFVIRSRFLLWPRCCSKTVGKKRSF